MPAILKESAYRLDGGENGVLLIHGFCGSARQMRYLADGLHAAGYTVSVPLLPGHGSTVREMRKSTFRQWHDCVRMAYADLREICSCVAVAGHSMGGVLALLLAEEYPADAVITLAAPMHLSGMRGLLSPFAFLTAPFLPYLSWPGARRYPDDFLMEDHIGYETLPVSKVNDLLRLMRRARRNLFAVTAPLLTVQSIDDPTVSVSSPRIIGSGVSSSLKRHILLNRSGHLIPLGPERRKVLDAMLDFLSVAITS